MKLDVLNLDAKKVGSEELDDSVFNAELKPHLLHEVVVSQLASRRAGTHNSKGRTDVRGGGAKPFKQKGTGRARQGTSRAPHMVGGGDALAVKPRDYSYRPNKKVMRAALRVALSLRAKQNNIILLDSLAVSEVKTKKMAASLSGLNAASALVVDVEPNKDFTLSTRNLSNMKCIAQRGVNVYDVLKYPKLVLTVAAAKELQVRVNS
jgi:large subunit ribosomal protein L4